MNILELFAGSRSFGKEAEKMGHEVYSVDWTGYAGINLVIDIEYLATKNIPFIPDVVWVSPDCTTYSIAACSTHRHHDKTAKSEYAFKCDEVNKRWMDLIRQWMDSNPNLIFFIENPRGNFRHMEFVKELELDKATHCERSTVWYCQYGDNRAKPTDIWTNSKTWSPRPMCRNYKYNKKTGEIIDKHCHHESARRGARTGTQGRKGSYERSIIPQELCEEIIKSIL